MENKSTTRQWTSLSFPSTFLLESAMMSYLDLYRSINQRPINPVAPAIATFFFSHLFYYPTKTNK